MSAKPIIFGNPVAASLGHPTSSRRSCTRSLWHNTLSFMPVIVQRPFIALVGGINRCDFHPLRL